MRVLKYRIEGRNIRQNLPVKLSPPLAMPRSSLLAALAGWLLPLSASQPDAGRYPALTTGAAQPVVEAVLPLPVQTVRARRLQSARPAAAPAHPEYGPQFAQFELATNESQRLDYPGRSSAAFRGRGGI
jgi:hypothetical protein